MRWAYGIVDVTFAGDPDRVLQWITDETLFRKSDPTDHFTSVVQAFSADTGRDIKSLAVAIVPMSFRANAKRSHPEGVTGENPAMVAEFVAWQKQRVDAEVAAWLAEGVSA